MFPATLPILLNVMVAGMFVASFLVIAQLNPEFRRVRWIAATYAVGMVTPLSEMVLPLASSPTPFMILSYFSFLLALAAIGPALSAFFGKTPLWRLAIGVIVVGAVARWSIWGGQRDNLAYEFVYQTPFALAAASCAITIMLHGRRSSLDRMLTVIFSLVAFHFLLKPFAAAYFGSGATASQYLNSGYAMFSQAFTGALLIAAGLTLLINVLQTVVSKNRDAAFTDPLTGLPNRRALHQEFERQSRDAGGRQSLVLAMVDIDRFKAINDRFGHERGDHVIREVGAALQRFCPTEGCVARVGGEEFVILLPRHSDALAPLTCETLRLSVLSLDLGQDLAVTVSLGFTVAVTGEDMNDALRRADRGLYRAKQNGRNRCEYEPPVPTVQLGHPIRLVHSKPS